MHFYQCMDHSANNRMFKDYETYSMVNKILVFDKITRSRNFIAGAKNK